MELYTLCISSYTPTWPISVIFNCFHRLMLEYSLCPHNFLIAPHFIDFCFLYCQSGNWYKCQTTPMLTSPSDGLSPRVPWVILNPAEKMGGAPKASTSIFRHHSHHLLLMIFRFCFKSHIWMLASLPPFLHILCSWLSVCDFYLWFYSPLIHILLIHMLSKTLRNILIYWGLSMYVQNCIPNIVNTYKYIEGLLSGFPFKTEFM